MTGAVETFSSQHVMCVVGAVMDLDKCAEIVAEVGGPGFEVDTHYSQSAPDPRMAEAIEVVGSKRQPDGRWPLERIHVGRVHFEIEGDVGTPSRWNTLRALRVLDWWNGTD